MRECIDLTGQRFGKLVVLKKSENKIKKDVLWDCICDCGNIKTIRYGNLKQGHTKSCGCLIKETNIKNLEKIDREFYLLINKKEKEMIF